MRVVRADLMVPVLATAGSARSNAKKRDKKERTKEGGGGGRRKNGSGKWAKPSIPIPEIDELIGEEEQKEEQKDTESGSPTQLPWIKEKIPLIHIAYPHPSSSFSFAWLF